MLDLTYCSSLSSSYFLSSVSMIISVCIEKSLCSIKILIHGSVFIIILVVEKEMMCTYEVFTVCSMLNSLPLSFFFLLIPVFQRISSKLYALVVEMIIQIVSSPIVVISFTCAFFQAVFFYIRSLLFVLLESHICGKRQFH